MNVIIMMELNINDISKTEENYIIIEWQHCSQCC